MTHSSFQTYIRSDERFRWIVEMIETGTSPAEPLTPLQKETIIEVDQWLDENFNAMGIARGLMWDSIYDDSRWRTGVKIHLTTEDGVMVDLSTGLTEGGEVFTGNISQGADMPYED